MKDLTEISVMEIMHRGVVSVDIETSFQEVINTFIEFKVHAIIVTLGGEFMGVLSHSDIISNLKKHGKKIFDMTAEDIMTPKPFTIDANASAKEAAAKMANNHIHRLLVMSSESGKLLPIGVLSASDIIKAVAI